MAKDTRPPEPDPQGGPDQGPPPGGPDKGALVPDLMAPTTYDEVRRHLRRKTLHVVAIYPRDVANKLSSGKPDQIRDFLTYSPWYLAHRDPVKLDQDKLNSLLVAFQTIEDTDPADGLGPFLSWLEANGYVVFNSFLQKNGAGLVVL